MKPEASNAMKNSYSLLFQKFQQLYEQKYLEYVANY